MQGNYIEDYFLIGGIAMIGLAEVAHLGAMLTGQSFSGCVMLFGIMLGLLLIGLIVWIALFRWHKCRSNKAMGTNKKLIGIKVLFFSLVLLQVTLIWSNQELYLGGDLTGEMVESILSTNAFYQVNPLTGQAYAAGVPTRLKILCLPTLYAFVCQVMGLDVEVVIWKIVPIIVLLGGYMAYRVIARIFWADNAFARTLFMVVVALCFLLGDYMYGVDGFGIMHAGYRGVTIRAVVLLPYTFALCLRKKWLLALLCVLAEACIVWTFYGMGACLLVIVGMYLVTMVQARRKKEDSLCKNS